MGGEGDTYLELKTGLFYLYHLTLYYFLIFLYYFVCIILKKIYVLRTT